MIWSDECGVSVRCEMSKDHHRREEDASTVMTICKQLHLLLLVQEHVPRGWNQAESFRSRSSGSLMDGAV